MNCDRVDALLDEYLDGDLPRAVAGAVAEHLRGCGACSSAEAGLRELRRSARGLPAEIEPARDLWPGIADRLVRRPAGRWRHGGRWYSLAAAAALVVAAGAVVIGVSLVHRRATAVAARRAAGPERGVAAASLDLAGTRADVERARLQLLAALRSRETALSPATRAVVEHNVRVIDEAVSEIQAALAREPGNRELATLLVATYRQEIDLLQDVSHIPGRG